MVKNAAPSLCAAFPELTSPSLLCSSTTSPFYFSFPVGFQFIFRVNRVAFACSSSLTGSLLEDPLSWKSSSLCNPPQSIHFAATVLCHSLWQTLRLWWSLLWREPQSFQKRAHSFFLFAFFSVPTGKASGSCCISLSSPERVGSMHLRIQVKAGLTARALFAWPTTESCTTSIGTFELWGV